MQMIGQVSGAGRQVGKAYGGVSGQAGGAGRGVGRHGTGLVLW